MAPMAASKYLMRAEKVHLKMEFHLKFMGWGRPQLTIISHANKSDSHGWRYSSVCKVFDLSA